MIGSAKGGVSMSKKKQSNDKKSPNGKNTGQPQETRQTEQQPRC